MFGNQILDMVFGPWAANALFCASRLQVFTYLAEKSMTAEELAAAVGAVPRFLTALLDACVGLRLLKKKDNAYMNSPLSQIYLVEGNPRYFGDFIEVMAVEGGNWDGLYNLMKGKETIREEEKKEYSPHRFTMAMNNLAMMGEADALAHALDIPNAGKMVDAGCGSGIYSVMLCRRNPNLNAVLLDRKEVLENTRKIIEKSNLQNRMTTREADIFTDSFGNGLDVVLLSDVLYQEEYLCIAILRSAYAALAPGGMLVVRGYYVDSDGDGPHSAFAPLFNIHQLFDDPKREVISVSLLRQWVEQVGFKIIKTFPLTERSHCLIARRLLTI